jgi:rubrerythrin
VKKWRCAQCGYIHDGSAPGPCPSCGAPAEGFGEVGDDEDKRIQRSRRTNALHCQLVSLAREIETACKSGIEDDLDPGCVDVFKKSLERSYEIMKLASAEMSRHVGKGKWS